MNPWGVQYYNHMPTAWATSSDLTYKFYVGNGKVTWAVFHCERRLP